MNNNGDTKNREIVTSFLRTGSLWSFRSDMRGRLGMPRQRCNDSFNSTSKKVRELSPASTQPLLRKKFSFCIQSTATKLDASDLSEDSKE